MKVNLLVVENREYILTEYAKMIVTMAAEKMVDRISFWHEPVRRSVWYTRKKMIEKALETDCTHVLFLDTDVIPQDKDFLARLASHGFPMVSGYYCDQYGNPINRLNGKPHMGEGVIALDVFSMGYSLIAREVLEKVPYPAPSDPSKYDADTEWCKACWDAGYTPACDFSLKAFQLILAAF